MEVQKRMSALKNLEQTLVQWQKQSPVHLPATWRRWLGDNSWWLVIIGVIAAALSVIGSLRTLLWAEDLMRTTRQFAESLGVAVPNTGLMYDVSLWISVATLAVVALIQLQSIQPLREKKKSGWDLLFLAMIISLTGSLISGLVGGAILSTVIGLAIAAVIGWFILFEIRGQFLPASKKDTTPKTDDPSSPKE